MICKGVRPFGDLRQLVGPYCEVVACLVYVIFFSHYIFLNFVVLVSAHVNYN